MQFPRWSGQSILGWSRNYYFVLLGSHNMGTKDWFISKISLPAGRGRTSWSTPWIGKVFSTLDFPAFSTNVNLSLYKEKRRSAWKWSSKNLCIVCVCFYLRAIQTLQFSRWINLLLNVMTLNAITQPLGLLTSIYLPEMHHLTVHRSGSWSKRL